MLDIPLNMTPPPNKNSHINKVQPDWMTRLSTAKITSLTKWKSKIKKLHNTIYKTRRNFKEKLPTIASIHLNSHKITLNT